MGCLMCKDTLEDSGSAVASSTDSTDLSTHTPSERFANRPSKTETKWGDKKPRRRRRPSRRGRRQCRQHGSMVPSIGTRGDNPAIQDNARRRSSTDSLPSDEPNDNDGDWDACQTATNFEETDVSSRPLPPSNSTEAETLDGWEQSFLADCIKAEQPRIVVTTASNISSSAGRTVHHPSMDAEELSSAGSGNDGRTSMLRIERINGCLFLNQYLVMKHLGHGSCGEVVLCLHIHNLQLYAIKVLRKEHLPTGSHPVSNNRRMQDIARDIVHLPNFDHENIVTVYEVIDDVVANRLLVVMEYREGGPIVHPEQHQRLPESLASQYFRDMVQGLDYLHSQRVVHGSLKPANVLVSTDGTAKLSDFSWTRGMVGSNCHLMDSSDGLPFCAPETLQPNAKYRGQAADIYALGACLYTLVFGRPPHSAPDFPQLLKAIQSEQPRFPESVPISDRIQHLLMRLLAKNPEERMTLPEIRHHPWVTDEGRYPIRCWTCPLRSEKRREASSDFDETIRELAAQSKHVRTYRKGDYIFRQGDPASFMLYIISGECEVLFTANLPQSPERFRRRRPFANSSTDSGDSSQTSSLSSEFSPDSISEDSKSRKRLIKASKEAYDLAKIRKRGDGKLLLAEIEAGEIVGEMALMSNGARRRMATVRAIKKTVTKFIANDDVITYLDRHPEARQHLQHLIWNRESARVTLEGVLRLGNLYETLLASDVPR